jgi:ribosome biogenesis GTPase
MVIRVFPGQYHVYTGQRTLVCTTTQPKGRPSNPSKSRPGKAAPPQTGLIPGDEVAVLETHPGIGQIVDVFPRRSRLARRAVGSRPGARGGEQVIVANVDQVVFVLAAANPQPHWNLLDRYLVAASATGLPALVCITKIDLVEDTHSQAPIEAVAEEYRRIGYTVLTTCAHQDRGLEQLRAALHGRVTALFGASGVGKTSLLNALAPGLGQRVNAVNPVTGDGRHTTTGAQIFPLGWAMIADTPGIREFGLWDVDPETLAQSFPEMQPYLGRCRFRAGCSHTDEPGCAVRAAVASGHISPRRFHSYLRLRTEG